MPLGAGAAMLPLAMSRDLRSFAILRAPSKRFGEQHGWAGLFTLLALVTGLAIAAWAHAPAAVYAALVVTAPFALAIWGALPGRLEIGDDGVSIRWRSETRFVPYAELASISTYDRRERGVERDRVYGVRLDLASGEIVRVPMGAAYIYNKRARRAARAIDAALERFRARGGDGAATAPLARGERTAEDWVRALRAVGEGANAGPREAPVPRERLVRIVEDPASAPLDRAAAASALSGRLDEGERERVNAAIEKTASPKLRVALERSLDDDAGALAEALDELDAESEDAERAARRRA